MTSVPNRLPVVRTAGALACVVVALCSLVGLGAAPAAAATHTITIKQYAYTPAGMTLSQGDTVTWTNQDTVEHDVSVTHGPASFHSPMLAKGQSWSHTFTTAGTYSYVCSVHPDMVASLTVRARPSRSVAPRAKGAAPVTTPSAPATTTTGSPDVPAAHAAHESVAAAAPAAPTEVVTSPTPSTLDPLLLVAGASTAVTVFCLLLLTTRPLHRPEG
jgi:plastocyanin